MKEDLAQKWNIKYLYQTISCYLPILGLDFVHICFRATTLYDRPGPQFKKITPIEKLCLLKKMNLNDFTKLTDSGEVQLKSDRPGLLVSSTSWTQDEDFSILFKALQSIHIHSFLYNLLIVNN